MPKGETMQPPEPNRDALRMAYLLALPAIEAQSFFWNYTGRKARRKAIDAAMALVPAPVTIRPFLVPCEGLYDTTSPITIDGT